VLPLDLPFERHPAVLDDGKDVLRGVRSLLLIAATASRAISGWPLGATGQVIEIVCQSSTPATRFVAASASSFSV
jgi:hypothetical protein